MHTIMALNVPLFIQKQIKAKRFNTYTNFEQASFCTKYRRNPALQY